MSPRFTPEAAAAMRAAIVEVGGREVFAVGEVDHGTVIGVEIVARGQEDQVLAILGRPRAGQVVIHNHPSGDLRPSDPDMALAGQFSEDGVGFVIVDNDVRNASFIVEPWQPAPKKIDPDDVLRFLDETLPTALPGWESRPAQREMALRVTAALNEGRPLVVEAGTGTGKSLAYLLPAAMWALANDAKVVIATHTRALQAQLVASDLPILARGGIEARTAVLEGRNNYLCKRRLQLARDEATELSDDAKIAFDALLGWAATTTGGSRSEIGFPVPPDVWERVESDSDLTLRMRCEHYDSCHYYSARRTAAGAHVIVVNHALLLADLVLREEAGFGLLPRFERVILDEAHHLEDVATGAGATRVTQRAVSRAVFPLRSAKKRPGAFDRFADTVSNASKVPPEVADKALAAASAAKDLVVPLTSVATEALGEIANLLGPEAPQVRIDDRFRGTELWTNVVLPRAQHLRMALEDASGALAGIQEALGDFKLPEGQSQSLLDLQRAAGRLARLADGVRVFTEPSDDTRVRWIERAETRREDGTAALCASPIDVAPMLKNILWEKLRGAVATSATLSVAGDFKFWKSRHGLESPEELVLPSPFDHFQQALLGLPNDLPTPDEPGFLRASARAIVDAIEVAGGGAFVLCTSHDAVTAYAAALRAALRPGIPVFSQGTEGRGALLARFKGERNAVLVGTDSFWEGVSVRGEALRLVIVPRLPFRVPTDPLRLARHEKVAASGADPFRAYTLPETAIKLRQGYGRLLRAQDDRGVVLILDGRVHTKGYGNTLLAALPPARRVKGPWTRVLDAIRTFYATTPRPAEV